MAVWSPVRRRAIRAASSLCPGSGIADARKVLPVKYAARAQTDSGPGASILMASRSCGHSKDNTEGLEIGTSGHRGIGSSEKQQPNQFSRELRRLPKLP